MHSGKDSIVITPGELGNQPLALNDLEIPGAAIADHHPAMSMLAAYPYPGRNRWSREKFRLKARSHRGSSVINWGIKRLDN